MAYRYFFSMSDEERHSESEFYNQEEEELAKTEQNNMAKNTVAVWYSAVSWLVFLLRIYKTRNFEFLNSKFRVCKLKISSS